MSFPSSNVVPLALFVLSAVSACALALPASSADLCALPAGHAEVPCLVVPPCGRGFAHVAGFNVSDGVTGPAHQQTGVSLCYTNYSLLVETHAFDTNVYSRYSGCNTECWNDDVLEVFAAPGPGDAMVYHEIDVGPVSGTLFVAQIANDLHGKVVDTLVDCGASGVSAHVANTTRGWRASVDIPWSLLLHGSAYASPPAVWRLNLYRLDQAVGFPQEFTAWSPTFKSPPAFHVPQRFGVMVLEGIVP